MTKKSVAIILAAVMLFSVISIGSTAYGSSANADAQTERSGASDYSPLASDSGENSGITTLYSNDFSSAMNLNGGSAVNCELVDDSGADDGKAIKIWGSGSWSETVSLNNAEGELVLTMRFYNNNFASGTTLSLNGVAIFGADANSSPVIAGVNQNASGKNFRWGTLTVTVSDLSLGTASISYVDQYGNSWNGSASLGTISGSVSISLGTYPNSFTVDSLALTQSAPMCTVTFSGEGIAQSTQSVVGSVVMPSYPSRYGYTLLGWSDGESTYPVGATVSISSDTSFVAVWGDYMRVNYSELLSSSSGIVDDWYRTVYTSSSVASYDSASDTAFIERSGVYKLSGKAGVLKDGISSILLTGESLGAVGWNGPSLKITHDTGIKLRDASSVTVDYLYERANGAAEGGLFGDGMTLYLRAGDKDFYVSSDESIVIGEWSTMTFDFSQVFADSADYSAVKDSNITEIKLYYYECSGHSVSGTTSGAYSSAYDFPVGDSIYVGDFRYPATRYTLTYRDGSTVLSEAEVFRNVELRPEISKLGFEFLGWTDGVSVFEASSDIRIIGDTELSAVWGALYDGEEFTVDEGEARDMTVYLANVDTALPIVVEFDLAQNGLANGALEDCAAVSVDGRALIRVTSGGALHVWNAFSGSYATQSTWSGSYYYGESYPSSTVHVKATIDVSAGSVRVEYEDTNGESYDVTVSGWSFGDESIDITFGGANGKQLSISDYSVSYTAKDAGVRYYVDGNETASVGEGKYVAYITFASGDANIHWNYSANALAAEDALFARDNSATVHLYTVSELYASAEAMSADALLAAGDVVGTVSYYSGLNRGAAVYEIGTSGSTGAIALDNGLYANIVPFEAFGKKIATVDQFGARGDGVTGDNTIIAQVLNLSGIDTVEFEADVYLQTANITVTKSNTEINGREAKIINDYTYVNWYDFSIGGQGSTTFTENVVLKNLTLECTETTGLGILFRNNDHVQLLITSADGVVIDSCNILTPDNSDDDRHITSIWANANVNDITIMDCNIVNYSNSSVGGGIWFSAGDENPCDNVVIVNNYIEKTSHDEIFAFFGGVFSNVYIDGNYIYSHSEPIGNASAHAIGFGVWGIASGMTNVTFTNNVVDVVSNKDAIMFANVSGLVMSGNKIRLSNNSQGESIEYGVFRVPTAETTQSNIEIFNNDIEVFCDADNTSGGYNILSMTYDLSSGFYIHDNTFTVNASLGYLSYSDEAVFRNNTYVLSSPLVCGRYYSSTDFDATNTATVIE